MPSAPLAGLSSARPSRPRAVAWRGLLALAAVWLAGAAAARELEVAVARGPVSLLFYVAEHGGHFAAEGVAVRLQDCGSGRECIARLAEGQVDAATAAEFVVTLTGLDRPRHVVVASVGSSVQQIKLVARRSAGIAEPADLRGKRVATVDGTSARYHLDRWLLYHGIDAAEVELRTLAPEGLAGALARREVDAVVIWEPHAAAARKALGDDVAALPRPRVYTQHFVLATTGAALAPRRDALARLLRALARAERLVAEQPAAAAVVLQARLGLGPGEAEAQMAEHDHRLRLDQSLVTTMDSQARWALQSGLAPAGTRPPNMLRAIDATLLRQTVPGAVGLVR